MLITHHPLIFRPLKRIDFNTPDGAIIQMAVKHQLAVYSAHTNYDIAKDGVNDILGQRLRLQNLEILHPVKPDVSALDESGSFVNKKNTYGIGRIGTLSEASSLKTLVSMVKKELGLDYVKVAGSLKKKVFRVAVCSGSGSSLMKAFLSSDADVYISGDIHYHDARDAEAVQRAIIDIGHFASEHLLVEALASRLDKRVRQAGLDATITACSIEEDPFTIT
jgi:dinuclear metal center YbgI/SA1388 family protein